MYLPSVSVVMPVYNASQYLSQCLDSLLGQDLKDIEIICVNDGSKDDSLPLLQCYAKKDARIKIIDKANSGAGDSRNAGFSQAKGKYVIFLDADDFFDRRMLFLAFDKMEETGADMVIFRYHLYDDQTGKTKKSDYIWPHIRDINKVTFSKEDVPEYIFNTFPNAPFVKLYKREFIAKNQLKFDNLKSCNDVTFSLLSLYYAKKIALLDQPLVYYRINTSGQISANRGKWFDSIYLALESFLAQCDLDDKYKNSFYSFAAGVLSYEYKQTIQKKEFLEKMQKFLPARVYNAFLFKSGALPFYKKVYGIFKEKERYHIYVLGIHLKIKKGKKSK